MEKIVVRQDDMDFRLEPHQYMAIHEEFIKRNLVETAVLQFAQFERVGNFRPEIVKYLNEAPNWDLQLHGWQHANYSEYDYHQIVKELCAAFYLFQKLFNRLPTVWYPPWNCYSPVMQDAANYMGIKIDNESCGVSEFVRKMKAGMFLGHSFYFHGYKASEMALLPEALDLVVDFSKEKV